MSEDQQGPTESVLRRIEGFAKDHHDSGYEQGFVDAYNQTQRLMARRSLVYLLAGLLFGGVIATLVTVSVVEGKVIEAPPADPIELGVDRGLGLSPAADFARAYTVGVVAEAVDRFGVATAQQSGSGFFYGDKGYILTNHHVIRGANRISVDWNSRLFDARVVGSDPRRDIAVLAISAPEVKGAEILKEDESVQIAEQVIAVGAPLGLDYTVTAGIVSHTARRLSDSSGVIYLQTDCSINIGNSGGPLVNRQGRVIGMNTKIASQSGDSAGISFAIPARFLIETADKIIAADSGISKAEVSEGRVKIVAYLGIDGNRSGGESGILLTRVLRGSPAERGGLKVGDVVRAVNGVVIYTRKELAAEIQQKYLPGDSITLTISRNGQVMEKTVKLEGIRR